MGFQDIRLLSDVEPLPSVDPDTRRKPVSWHATDKRGLHSTFQSWPQKEKQLFLGLDKAVPVDTGNHLLEVLRYIHRNPVKADIVRTPYDYNWSSHQGYLSWVKKWSWLHEDNLFTLSVFFAYDSSVSTARSGGSGVHLPGSSRLVAIWRQGHGQVCTAQGTCQVHHIRSSGHGGFSCGESGKDLFFLVAFGLMTFQILYPAGDIFPPYRCMIATRLFFPAILWLCVSHQPYLIKWSSADRYRSSKFRLHGATM